MENLDKLDKLLGQFPGERAVFYAGKLGCSRSSVYDYLKSLQLRERAYGKNGLWYPKEVQFEEPSKPARKLSRQEKYERERLARFYALADHASRTWPEFKPLKKYADTLKKQRKELGLE